MAKSGHVRTGSYWADRAGKLSFVHNLEQWPLTTRLRTIFQKPAQCVSGQVGHRHGGDRGPSNDVSVTIRKGPEGTGMRAAAVGPRKPNFASMLWNLNSGYLPNG